MKMNNAHRYYIFSYISYYIFSSFNNTKIEIETKVTDAIYQIHIFWGVLNSKPLLTNYSRIAEFENKKF